jgi:hypothetical protein
VDGTRQHDVRVQGHPVRQRAFPQGLEIRPEVRVAVEHGLPIVAALNDQVRLPWHDQTG